MKIRVNQWLKKESIFASRFCLWEIPVSETQITQSVKRFCEEVHILDAETGWVYNKYGSGIINAKTSIVYIRLKESPDDYEEAVKIDGVWYLPNRRHLKPPALRAEVEAEGFKVLYQDCGNIICALSSR